MRETFQKAKIFIQTYERYLTTGAFLFGFVVDSLTLTRIDLLYDNLVLLGYLLVAGFTIFFMGAVHKGNFSGSFFEPARALSPLAMQFAFGGLFSGFFIFYTRSATLAASWPFLVLLLALLIGNEFFKNRYQQLVFQLSMFFFVLFSFMIFYVPILMGEIGAQVFLLSGIASLGIIYIFVRALGMFLGDSFAQNKRTLAVSIGAIFLVVNVLYFTNIIPPIPLSLKEAGVYHSVVRSSEGYEIKREEKQWYERLRVKDSIQIPAGAPVYVFSSVFAPTDLQATIMHEWQYYNEQTERWDTRDRFTFAISGGRDGGYRGFTNKRSIEEGVWRVNIKTKRGQLIGRETFDVKIVSKLPELETITR